ncbi:hypothetical protein [Novispirillum itersonii]|uniref:hypothetical protein n=1 Tax=Novispirillum itersonii TaxID=189 RepID=UPI000367B6CD|nr:hypothetical protein [Novispirillum itersonii]
MRSGQIYQQRSLALTLLGLVLFLPPLVLLVMTDRVLFGVPVVYLWFFGIWLALILAGRILARRLDRITRGGGRETRSGGHGDA